MKLDLGMTWSFYVYQWSSTQVVQQRAYNRLILAGFIYVVRNVMV